VPTREGAAVFALAVSIFLLATNLMSGLLFVLDALLVSAFVVGAGTAVLPLRGLRVERRLPPRGTEGDRVTVELRLRAAYAGRFLVVEDGWAGVSARTLVPHVPPGVAVDVALPVVPPRRGRFAANPVAVASRGLLGLFTARRYVGADGHITVWPRPRPVSPRVLARLVPAIETAGEAQRARHREDLYGIRDYQPGDQANRIHWRSSVRRGALVVREFERPVCREAALLLDLDRRQSPDRLDAAVRAAASVLRAARDRGARVVVMGWEDTLVEHREWETAMDWLAGVTPSGPPLADVLPALRGRGGLIVVASSPTVVHDPGVLLILPADETPADRAAGWLVYAADGTVHAW
jgi:uncharacterized protein (DUF58 family)